MPARLSGFQPAPAISARDVRFGQADGREPVRRDDDSLLPDQDLLGPSVQVDTLRRVGFNCRLADELLDRVVEVFGVLRQDLEIGLARHLHLELAGTIPAPNDMGMWIHEAGHENTAARIEGRLVGIGGF